MKLGVEDCKIIIILSWIIEVYKEEEVIREQGDKGSRRYMGNMGYRVLDGKK